MALIGTLKQTGVSTHGRAGTSGRLRDNRVLSALLNLFFIEQWEMPEPSAGDAQEMAPLEAALAAYLANTHPYAVRSAASERPRMATYGNCSPRRIYPSVFFLIMNKTVLPAPQPSLGL